MNNTYRIGRQMGVRRLRACWGLLLIVGFFLYPGQGARAQMTPEEVRMAASNALSEGNYEEAIVHLQQLVDWYGDSTQQNIVAVLGEWYFNLGLSYLFTAEFPAAEEIFTLYLNRFPNGPYAQQVAVLQGDVRRYQTEYTKAIEAYDHALRRYQLSNDLSVDAHIGMARCHLAEDRWGDAIPSLRRVFNRAPDFARRNWAATTLAISYLQERQPEALYPIMTTLIQPDSFTSRSVMFNMVALEVADEYFSDEDYLTALWIYRLVYPHDVVMLNTILYQERMEGQLTRVRRTPRDPRPILRIQETLGDIEAELEALSEIENYDPQLFFRVARGYMENMRYREARDLFRSIHEERMEEFAEQALYLALIAAFRTEPVEQTIDIARTYMDDYPDGDYYDDASMLLGQIYITLSDWPNVLATLSEALSHKPQHNYISEILFMLGYASFMEEMFEEAVGYLTRLNTEFPQNDRYPDAEYWIGMSHLFDGDYESAIPHFLNVIYDPDGEIYHEDASFRHASCVYGLGNLEEAESLLLSFMRTYPDSRLGGEAYVMLGDTAGARGDVTLALERFQHVFDFGEHVNIELYNYTAFRMGEMMNDTEQFGRMIRLFEDYLQRNREGSNQSQAQYWIGHGYWQQDEQVRALQFYLETIKQYGRDRMELGIDLIMEDWVGKTRAASPELQRTAWRDLNQLHDQAMRDRDITLALRLKRIMMFDPNVSDGEANNLRLALISPRLIPHASMSNLQYMLSEAQRRQNDELVLLVAQELVTVFPETDAGMEARLILGLQAAKEEEYDTALQHFNVVRELFAGSDLAAQALMMIGRIHMEARRFEEADQAFSDVLGVREWRSYWPEALYGRGESARANRNFERAAAFYERIYVLYSGAMDWAAKAYLARAECLQRLREMTKAREVLEEFIGLEDFAEYPEYQEAMAILQQLRRRL